MSRIHEVFAMGALLALVACGGGGSGDADGGDADGSTTPEYDATPVAIDAAAPPDAEVEVCVGGSSAAALRRGPSITVVGGGPRLVHHSLAVPGPQMCNPVAQTGCQANEKCANLVENDDPFVSTTTCVPDGTVPLGGACTEGLPGPDTGYDDCVAGTHCSGGVCAEICTQAPDSCPTEQNCVPFSGVFDDLDGLGLCQPQCDVLEQNCCNDEGCYVSLASGQSSCAPALSETPNGTPGRQGDACMFLNTCDVGFGCTQLDAPVDPMGNVCAKFCDPTNMGGPTCTDTGSAETCVVINGDFYSNATNVPVSIGFCVDCVVWADVPGCQ